MDSMILYEKVKDVKVPLSSGFPLVARIPRKISQKMQSHETFTQVCP